jgi:hypothetical protein
MSRIWKVIGRLKHRSPEVQMFAQAPGWFLSCPVPSGFNSFVPDPTPSPCPHLSESGRAAPGADRSELADTTDAVLETRQ